MKDRIKKVMDESGLSASKFADKIGVPRSGLSHVLSGRNKPSLDYVLKMLNAFPELDPYWLIKGKKSTSSIRRILDDENDIPENNSVKGLNNSIAQVNKKMESQADKLVKKIAPDNSEDHQYGKSRSKRNQLKKEIDRIVYFYTDGSFKEYFAER